MQRVVPIAVLAAVALASPARAQLETPPNWKWVTDSPARLVTGQDTAPGGWQFVAMPPGWHVTMGPGGILYDPAYVASDRFALEVEIFLFTGTTDAGYGIFVGGSDLEGAGRTYIAFLARRDGAAGVFRFAGARPVPIIEWRRHEPVLPGTADGTAKNIIRIEAEQDSVAFEINGTKIATMSRTDLALDGAFGLRIGEGVNVHASNLDLTRRLAPTPPPKQ